MSNSHFNQSLWVDFIRDTLCGVYWDKLVKNMLFLTGQPLISDMKLSQ